MNRYRAAWGHGGPETPASALSDMDPETSAHTRERHVPHEPAWRRRALYPLTEGATMRSAKDMTGRAR